MVIDKQPSRLYRFMRLLPFYGNRLLEKEHRARWNRAVAGEIMTTDPKLANWIIFQMDGSFRLVVDRPFFRRYDIGFRIEEYGREIDAEMLKFINNKYHERFDHA